MRLMQHMFPQLLTNVPDYGRPHIVVPDGAVLKNAEGFDWSGLGAISSGIAGIVSGVGNIINTPQTNRAAQEIARQQTIQANIAATSAAEARAQQLAIVKFIVPAALLALTIYLVLK